MSYEETGLITFALSAEGIVCFSAPDIIGWLHREQETHDGPCAHCVFVADQIQEMIDDLPTEELEFGRSKMLEILDGRDPTSEMINHFMGADSADPS